MIQDTVANNFDDAGEGRYANHFSIGHNAFEVILQFGQFYEGNNQPVMHTRIVTSPAYAQILLQLLTRSLAEYESTFGTISSGRPHE
jgi:uncharacterized protein DUF3467